MSKSNFPKCENAVRCERPDRDLPTVDPGKTEDAFDSVSDDLAPNYDLEPESHVSRIADEKQISAYDSCEDIVKAI